ncbi:unnamed protein product [Clonostachys rosea f. rosea IK726]|uniref:Uncharacterized protein n=1 Tax=Clonostachys rosea f. rosea IK726 TaxID=1349383 RepID=A0ACA9THU3_BIOOC|nr:unnamed protein product [Clonostachys rosea f. rosea IK726]
MASRSRSRSRSQSPPRGRRRSWSRSPTPRSADSRSPDRRRRFDSRSPSRLGSRTPPPSRRNGRHRSDSRSWSRGRGRSNSKDSEGPLAKSTKIVVERLSKNINENHLHEIFGEFGPIKDLDLPINRTFGTNRGTAYILYDYEGDAEAAIAHMHEAQVDGATINVSIVLPRRKLSPAPPMARRGANIDPRVPFGVGRGGGAHGSGEVAEDGVVTPHPRADIITDQMSTGHHHARLQSRRWEGLDLPGVEAAGIAAAPETLSLLGRGPGHPCPDDGAATMWVRAGVEVGALATLALVTGADPRAALEFAKNLVITG